MKAISYKDDLLVELQDPEYASMYLEQTLETGDMQAFLIAMRDVVEARGGVAKIAQSAQMQRQGLYKVLSSRGNPRLATLQGILKSMGLRMAITQALPASAS
jgi:probable addiction module antidote protein